ncbi:MAG: DNA cytosine methyltransferase [Dolichospermum sp.]
MQAMIAMQASATTPKAEAVQACLDNGDIDGDGEGKPSSVAVATGGDRNHVQEYWRVFADNLLRSRVTLKVTPKENETLTEDIKTSAPHAVHLQPGVCNLIVRYDTKLGSEANSRPASRKAPLRDVHLKSCITAARKALPPKGPGTLRPAVVQIIKESGYCVTWDSVNTAHHGIPQSRPRLFIVAIRADSCDRTFKFPKKLNILPSVDLFLKRGKPHHGEPQLEPPRLLLDNDTARRNMNSATESLAAKGIDPAKVSAFVDVLASSTFANCKAGVCPCITASRSKVGGFYVTTLKRMTYYQELGGLQGFPMKKLRKLLTCHHVKQNTTGHAIGNAISVNVLMRLLPRILVAAGLVQPTVAARSDLWKRLTKTQLRSMNTLPDDLYHTRRDVSQ